MFNSIFVSLENVSAIACMHLQRSTQKILRLEELKIIGHKMGNLNHAQAFGVDPAYIKARSNKRLKKVDVYSGITTGWFSLNPEGNAETMLALKSTVVPKQLEQFTVRFGGIPAINEIFMFIAEALSVATELKFLTLELSNCRVSDVEIMTLAQILHGLQHIKQFVLKVIQYPNLSKDCIYYLIRILLQYKNLEKFEVYLRRLNLDDTEIASLLENLSKYENLKVVCFQKQSLLISKTIKN